MSVATITKTPATPAVKADKAPVRQPAGTNVPVELDTAVALLRKRYESADKGETAARANFEAADLAWQNARVIKVRVAYAAAMLTPNKGAANLLAATRYLLTDPADTAGKRTAQAKSRKNTLRNYVAAGEALQEAGLANNITEPDEQERKIVADVFRAMNKRDKQEAKDAAGDVTPEEAGAERVPEDTPDDALSFVDLVGHVARLNSTFNLLKSNGTVISEQEAGKLSEMLAEFSAQLAEYSADK